LHTEDHATGEERGLDGEHPDPDAEVCGGEDDGEENAGHGRIELRSARVDRRRAHVKCPDGSDG